MNVFLVNVYVSYGCDLCSMFLIIKYDGCRCNSDSYIYRDNLS